MLAFILFALTIDRLKEKEFYEKRISEEILKINEEIEKVEKDIYLLNLKRENVLFSLLEKSKKILPYSKSEVGRIYLLISFVNFLKGDYGKAREYAKRGIFFEGKEDFPEKMKNFLENVKEEILQSPSAIININVDKEADIYLDGILQETKTLKAKEGIHTITITGKIYESMSFDIEFKDTKNIEIMDLRIDKDKLKIWSSDVDKETLCKNLQVEKIKILPEGIEHNCIKKRNWILIGLGVAGVAITVSSIIILEKRTITTRIIFEK